GFVAQVGNALDGLLAHQVRDALDQILLVDLVGNLGDDDRDLVAPLAGLGRGPRAHDDRAAAGRVRLDDPAAPDDEAGGRGIRAGNQSNELLELLSARERSKAVGGTRVLSDIRRLAVRRRTIRGRSLRWRRTC